MDELIFIEMVTLISIYTVFVLSGVCYARWLRPFCIKKQHAYLTAGSYTAVTIIINLLPWDTSRSLLRLCVVAVPLIVLYVTERRNLRQKIFLCTVFVVIRWLVAGIFTEISFFETRLMQEFEIFRTNVTAILTEYVVWKILWTTGILVVLNVAIRIVLKVYKRKNTDMTWQELIMLLAPMGALFFVKPLTLQYYELWSDGISQGYIRENIPGNVYRLCFYMLSFAAILVLISFYRQVKNRQEESYSMQILEQQLAENKRHMEQVEALYADMRALKHDMGNHVTTLEHLIEKGQKKEAAFYIEALKEGLSEAAPEVITGNPVTDVILSEYAAKCKEKAIPFEAGFLFPGKSDINAFDLSIVLNNALQNAMEASVQCENPAISIASVCKNNTYIVCVKNVIADKLPVDVETGIPFSTKKEGGHGYGLKNIRNVALRYKGDIDIRQEMDETGQWLCILHVMLQMS